MRRLITVFAGIVGVLVWGYLVTLGAAQLAEQPVDYDMQDLEVPDLDELQLPEAGEVLPETEPHPQLATADDARKVRAIEPDAFGYPAYTSAANLERVDARLPLSETSAPKATVTVLHRPFSPAAGILAFDEERRIRLKDIEATAPSRTCALATGGTWPCGEMARTQQRQFIRNRSVSCEAVGSGWHGEVVTRCWIGAQEVSAWLAKQGWVEAKADSSLASLTETAKSEARGLFAAKTP